MTDHRFDEAVKRKLDTLEGYESSKSKIDQIMGNKLLSKSWQKRHLWSLSMGIIGLIAIGYLGYTVKDQNKTIEALTFAISKDKSKLDIENSSSNSITNTEIATSENLIDSQVQELSKDPIVKTLKNSNNTALNVQSTSDNSKRQNSKQKSIENNNKVHKSSGNQNSLNTELVNINQAPILEKPKTESIDKSTSTLLINSLNDISDLKGSNQNIVQISKIKNIVFTPIVSNHKKEIQTNELVSSQPLVIDPIITIHYQKWGIGVGTGVGHENINFGLIVQYKLGNRIGLATGIRFNKNRDRRYDDDDSFNEDNHEDFIDKYAPNHGGNKFKHIVVRENRIEIPIYFQYFRPISPSLFLTAYAGPVFSFSERHSGSFQIQGTTDNVSFTKSFNKSIISSGELGLGIVKNYKRFSFQLTPSISIPLSPENSIQTKHHLELDFFGQFRALYHFN